MQFTEIHVFIYNDSEQLCKTNKFKALVIINHEIYKIFKHTINQI